MDHPSTLIPFIVNNAPPLIFIEARLLGSPAQALVSQLGLTVDAPDCSVAVFTRTSGLLLITGAGWYAAYRICTRYLGNRFVSVLVDGTQCNQLADADRRLLYPHESTIPEEDEDAEEEKEERRREREEEGDTVSESEIRSRTPSELSMSRVRRSMRARGLFSIGARRSSREGVIRREGARAESSIGSNSIAPPQGRLRAVSQSSSASSAALPRAHRISASSSRASDVSASLNIVWETQATWDDEFDVGEGGNVPQTPVRPRMATIGSMGDMCSIFDDVLSVTSGSSAFPGLSNLHQEHDEDSTSRIRFPSFSNDEAETSHQRTSHSEEEDEEGRIHDIPCMRDSSYMYRSVIVAGSEFGGSDAMSTSSRISNMSRLVKREGEGLWGLSDLSATIPSMEGRQTTSRRSKMEESHDSGVLLTTSMSSKAASSGKRSTTMFDSAIDPDLSLSSDENDRIDRIEETTTEESIPRRQRQDDSISYAPSTMSLEWFDEGLRRGSLQEELPIELPSIGTVPATSSRDVMIFAKEHFSPKSAQLKALTEMYSKRRLRRMGRIEDSRSDLESILTSAIYHQVPLARGKPEEIIQRVRRCFERYNCLRRWRPKLCGWEELLARVDELRSFQQRGSFDIDSCPGTVEGMRILMALRACELFDAKMAGTSDLEWLNVERPDEVLSRLDNHDFEEMEWRLSSEAFFINVNVFEFKTALGRPPAMGNAVLCPSDKDPGTIRTLPFLRADTLGGEVRVRPQCKLIPLYNVPHDDS